MILITGANGHIGRRLIAELGSDVPIRALVRSKGAARTLAGRGVDVRIVDYLDSDAMIEAARACSHIVHLVGIIRESGDNSFAQAHEGTMAVLLKAARNAGIRRIVYLSILGADAASANACLASRGRAERALLEADVPSLVIRIPMVLGEDDYAGGALLRRVRRRFDFQYRAASLEQPIYAGDVVNALRRGLDLVPTSPEENHLLLELAGPESISRAELTRRAARVLGIRAPRVVSLPLALGMLLAGLLELLSPKPRVSRAMLGVLDHDDRIDPAPAAARLGLSLTPLDETLRRVLADQSRYRGNSGSFPSGRA